MGIVYLSPVPKTPTQLLKAATVASQEALGVEERLP